MELVQSLVQNSEARSRSLELGNSLLIWKNRSEFECTARGRRGVATGEGAHAGFTLGGGAGGAGRERMSPKIALTTACPGGYFSFLYYRQGKRDSDVGSVVDLVSAPPHVLGYLEVTPEAPICAHGFLRLFSGTFSGLGSVGELIHQEQPSTRELMANTSTCLFLDKTVFFIGSKNSLCKIYHLNYFLCLPYVV